MLVNIQDTPNPLAVKFVCNREVSPLMPQTFTSKDQCRSSSLAQELLSLPEVSMVFFGTDFITITKEQSTSWEKVKSKIVLLITKHFEKTDQVFDIEADRSQPLQEQEEVSLPDIERQIKQVIEEYIRPAIMLDGGDIEYLRFNKGIVYVKLVGACKGCPSSTITLKQGVQNTIQYHVPEVISVEIEDLLEDN
ncbi:NifU family protein [Candidatus Sneabacter namystus]|uniref:NifU family protein n=1 Tax=Candidatus Sneabacter namystus TaxID=2601646 RepID=A0A5C0ULU1_9RICK|nr:NifU family protein [Candidatus Sneabacter namystus]QEK39864.1 NifU family protein [Candidatus Sneabacter namystus]